MKKRTSTHSKPELLLLLLAVLFFFSGIAGLGYQIVWAKFFSAGIGHEFPAVLAVVTAFMAGMAIGAGAMYRWNHWLQGSKVYGFLELLIGLWGVVTALVIPKANLIVIHLLGPNPSHAWHWFVVFLIVLITLLPATAAMGATLPAIERFTSAIARKNTVGLLYAMNTAGALCGGIVTVFWCMPRFGIVETLLILACLNVLCGIAALSLVSKAEFSAGNSFETAEKSISTEFRYLKASLLFTGLLGIAYETVAVRALSHILENTVYTFAVVLGIHLLGTAIGAGFYHKSAIKKSNGTLLFTLLAGGSLVGALLLWFAQPLYSHFRAALNDTLYSVALAEMSVAALIFLLPSIAMGATFSFLAERSLRQAPNLGLALLINTSGAAFAPVLFGLVLIPSFGLKLAFCLIPLGYSFLIPKRTVSFLLIAIVAASSIFIPGTKELIEKPVGSKFRSLKEGIMASVAVIEDPRGDRVLKVNNRFQMGGTGARLAEQRHADLPLLLHPDPHRALFIGLGTGITFATARFYPGLQTDGVELLPEVAESMPYFETSPEVLKGPALSVHVADGRRYVLTTTNRYDVIVADLFHPAQDGAGFLYSREHFAAIRECLAPGGLFCQWLPLYQMDLGTLRIITQTFMQVFPDCEAWLLRFNVDTPVIGLIARSGTALSQNWVERRLTNPVLNEHLKEDALADSVRLFGCHLANNQQLREFVGSAPINTDLFPIVLFRAPLLTFRKNDDPSSRLLELMREFSPPTVRFAGTDAEFQSRVEKYCQARNVYLQGLAAEAKGEMQTAIAGYLDSARLSAEFTSGYAQCLAIATAMSKRNPATARMILLKLDEAQPQRGVARELMERLQLTP